MFLIEFATCNRAKALVYITYFFKEANKTLHSEKLNCLLDLVERDIIRIKNPFIQKLLNHPSSCTIGITNGKNFTNPEEVNKVLKDLEAEGFDFSE